MNLKLVLTAATLLAGLTATSALAAGVHGFAEGIRSDASPDTPCKVIYLSDATAPNDFLYNSGSPWGSYTPLPVMPAVDDGLGLYATKDLIFAGASPNRINVYKPCGSAVGYSLATAGYGPPTNIAVDYSRNVYAIESGTPYVDWFNPSGTDTLRATDAPRSPGLPSYVAVDNAGYVYTSGWDPTNGFQQIDRCTPTMSSCSFCEAIPSPSWPGGITIDSHQNIVVNNEIGSIYVYYPGCGTLASSWVYSPTNSTTHFHFTAITLGHAENAIWGAKQFDVPQPGCTTPFCMDAQAEHYNVAGIVGPIVAPAHTPIIAGNQPGAGIAVWPPGPI